MTYLIEFRLSGYAKKYARQLINDISKKFRARGMKGKVPHISLYGPFTTNNERIMVREVCNLCRKYDRIFFSFRGFNYFDNSTNKVVYLDVVPSEDLKLFRLELSSRLRKITSSISREDRKGAGDFKFHTTLAFKDIDHKFGNVWEYISRQRRPNIRQTLLRVTILKKSRILYEYDFMLRRLLNRREALSKTVYRETIRRLSEGTQQPAMQKERILKPSLWNKLKDFFSWKLSDE